MTLGFFDYISKAKTMLRYVAVAFGSGADISSKIRLSFLLPRTRWLARGRESRTGMYLISFESKLFKLYLRPQDIFVLNDVLVEKCYAMVERVDSSPRVIFDLGAHIGLSSICLATRFPKSKIRAYEPVKVNFELLTKNTDQLDAIDVFNVAVGSATEAGYIFVSPTRLSGSSLIRDERPEFEYRQPCAIMALDEILLPEQGPGVLIKFDIEGAEFEVFGSSKIVQSVDFLIGEIKVDAAGLSRFLGLFPNHSSSATRVAVNMYVVFLTRFSGGSI